MEKNNYIKNVILYFKIIIIILSNLCFNSFTYTNGKFEVLNEQTGDLDFLLFPGDIDNDDHNCSNICNCQCTITYG